MQLILCGNQDGRDVCLRERFELRPSGDGFDESSLENPGPDVGSPAPYDDDPVVDTPNVPWVMFLLMLLSSGWFLRPVGFDQKPGKDTVARRQRNAMLRISFFLTAWIAAFTLLPLWAATLALVGWIVKVAPGIRIVQREFQNVGPDELLG